MEFLSLMMERVMAFWRNRRFFQFRKFHCTLWKPHDGFVFLLICVTLRISIRNSYTTRRGFATIAAAKKGSELLRQQ